MSHFAEIDNDSIVVRVLVIDEETILSGSMGDVSKWVQTSYNNSIRKQFAGIGDFYDVEKDIFIKPQPYPSWTLDSNNDWQPPVLQPAPTGSIIYKTWDEDDRTWVSGSN
jgi:hypothetical protein